MGRRTKNVRSGEQRMRKQVVGGKEIECRGAKNGRAEEQKKGERIAMNGWTK